MADQIPFVAVTEEWFELKQAVLERVSAIFDHGQFVDGPELGELESSLARRSGTEHVIACGSGTTALLMSLMALDIGPGDEVIVPSFTFAAPVECIKIIGASPVLVDVVCPSGLIDISAIEASITPRTKAIIAVSLFGHPPDFKAINALAARHGLIVIEDAAQSFGATQGGKESGALADIGCFSFYPTKVLGGAGDGGALITDNPEFAERARQIRDHGQGAKYDHVRLGLNGRMGSIAAAALLVRLSVVAEEISKRQAIGTNYDVMLDGLRLAGQLDFQLPHSDTVPVRPHYPVFLKYRDDVAQKLHEAGIGTAVHYPKPLHFQPAFTQDRRADDLGQSEKMAREILCLPVYPSLSDDQQARVVEILISAVIG